MSKVRKTIQIVIDVDTDVIAPRGVYTWIFQLINRLGYEHDIISLTVDGTTVDTEGTDLDELPLGENKPLSL